MTLSRKYNSRLNGRAHDKRFSAIPGSIESIRDLENEMTRVVRFEQSNSSESSSGQSSNTDDKKKLKGRGIRDNITYRNHLNQIKKIPKSELINTTKLLSFT
jgi:hypothetical protein